MNNKLEDGVKLLIKDLRELGSYPIVDSVENRETQFEFTVEFNAIRILTLIHNFGRNNRIRSKIQFSFIDFLLRYPICMKKLIDLEKIDYSDFSPAELINFDKKMVKHLSSAWDTDYYNYLGFLEARKLIQLDFKDQFSIKITKSGIELLKSIQEPLVKRWAERSKILKNFVGNKNDDSLQSYIQRNFSFTVI